MKGMNHRRKIILTEADMNQARTNPEFLKFLQEQEDKARDEKNISELYQVLDTLLVLDLDEERIHSVYQEILKIAFETIEERLMDGSKLELDGGDIFFIRSFYEHAIEKWSVENFDGAKELFFILTQIVNDEKLQEAMTIHMIATAKQTDIDSFYDEAIIDDTQLEDEKYGYFITNFSYDQGEYLNSHSELIQEQYQQMKHLING
jgi:hypothetical protein